VKHKLADVSISKVLSACEVLSPEEMRRALKVIADRREKFDPALLRGLGQAYERYDAGLRSRWDSYEGAIEAAEGDPDRLVDCLRAQKPFAEGDQDRLATYIGKKLRRRLWPRWLEDALSRAPTEVEFDRLADLVAEVCRKRGRITDAPAHRAARLARVLLSPLSGRIDARLRTGVITFACKTEGNESGVKIDPERVRNLLDHPRARDTNR
jgi:hypothetical protein